MAPTRSLTWRILPWLLPLGMILIGLIFVVASLSDTDEPTASGAVAPTNVRELVEGAAPAWVQRQAGADVAAEVQDVIMVGADPTGAQTYRVRAVVVRHDSRVQPAAAPPATVAPLADDAKSTVATCVRWDVDVTTDIIVEQGALEIRREVGHVDYDDADALRAACADVAFAG